MANGVIWSASTGSETAGCKPVYQEQASVLVARSELEAVMGFLRKGDTLVVTKIDRLARNTRVLGQIVDGLHARGIFLKVLP
jgi:DNA invertase Pin-like site-specific DNA recombinase